MALHNQSRRIWQTCGFPLIGFLGAALLLACCTQALPQSHEESTPAGGAKSLQLPLAVTVSIAMVPTATPTPTITVSPVSTSTLTVTVAATPTRTPGLTASMSPEPVIITASLQVSPIRSLTDTLTSLCWIAFSPTNQDPDKGIAPSDASLREDLRTVRAAGFDGLVTYGSENRVYRFAPEIGFKAMIMGVWDPASESELSIAEDAGKSDFVVGFAVGNEGLHKRYELNELTGALDRLRRSTGKPATTTEESPDYSREPALANLGDWVFPNVHPYFQHKTDPVEAVNWTVQTFERFAELASGRVIVFKEVGLPTDGDKNVDEQKQADYYRLLQRTSVRFVYFESFNQPWKIWLPVEPYWGIFRSDRSPKTVIPFVCGKQP
jgi:exo-beta-1,3-glucanase (GH17 family)